jgi:hypothetical protein
MKKIVIICLFLLTGIGSALACETEVTTDKESYEIGDIAELTLTIHNDHSRCNYDGEEPELAVRNASIESKSSFSEIQNGVWQITYNVLINGSDAAVRLVRNCPKGGFNITHEFSVR